MKKQTIWILTILMAIAFVGLLCIQIFYMKNIVRIRYEQFSQGVRQSLVAVAQRLEQDEARHFLEEDVNSIRSSSIFAQYLGENVPNLSGVKYSFTTSTGLEADLTIKGGVQEISKLQVGTQLGTDHYSRLQNNYHDRYLYQKGMIDDVILNIVSSASSRPIAERADSAVVARYLRQELDTLGLTVPFEFAVANYAGTVLYKSRNFRAVAADRDNMFVQALFPNDNTGRLNYLKVYFPTKKDYIFSSIKFMVPAFAFTFILLIIFVFTIIVAFRQKKLTEMKNDFINNMTHEFKTPISSISLAAQMLNDPSVRKSPAMMQQISNVINDETKRLRFQVEKVLLMSMFDRQKVSLKLKEIDANSAIDNIVNTFKLKVEKYGGRIHARLDADDAIVNVDEMHFTNVIFNLLDNAVKYRRDEEPLELTVSTRNIGDNRLEITVADNGIGIRRDDLRKIFDKFYRVSTGNRHDVKGFGLGLAYVRKMVGDLGGEITAESEFGAGTTFKIILPLTN
ncbi:MAG: HAMP domain-containing histidine kinase [Muribaculaceae bacterium]|nr:HAMP domain-containing histidine kinase [Muribaculaceae bacterium]MDE6541101.1 HAMP domain-containing histidine kinase [Muribaculaceae bacterium]